MINPFDNLHKGDNMNPNSRYNFDEIVKARYITADRLPDNIVRVRPKAITLSGNLYRLFQSTAKTTEKGYVKVSLGVAYDNVNQAIRVFPKADGFVCSLAQNKSGEVTSINLPFSRGMIRANFVPGDYMLVQGETDVFQLINK